MTVDDRFAPSIPVASSGVFSLEDFVASSGVFSLEDFDHLSGEYVFGPFAALIATISRSSSAFSAAALKVMRLCHPCFLK